MAHKLKKIGANPECAIKRKEEKILNEAIKEVEKIKEETPVPTPMSIPLTKAPSAVEVPTPMSVPLTKDPSVVKAPTVTVEDPMVPENKVVEVDKPESRVDVDERSVIQKAFDRADEKLTFKDW